MRKFGVVSLMFVGFVAGIVNDNYTSPPATITLPYCLVATDG